MQTEIKGAHYVNGRLDMNDGTTRGFVWPGAAGKYMFEGALVHRVWREVYHSARSFVHLHVSVVYAILAMVGYSRHIAC